MCALNPGMTQSVAAMLYGTEHMDGILSGFLRCIPHRLDGHIACELD